ncbi:MAG: Asp-tRNA(Asn)/Glu-tRNA(Gln) amidotransferase subunit GatA [Phycisphaerae bacterium]|nr:Asp-tRNA(Asn)/Glu-tRNA(Gln) amidotransferase subunit GatA [Phycisphaerae bacterium]
MGCPGLRRAIGSGQVTAVDAARATFEAIDRQDAVLGAYLTLFRDQALAQARQIDERIGAGLPVGPLAGVPVAVKDVLCTAFGPTTCGSKTLAHFHAPYHATVIERLLAADAVIVGKTNMDEFAMGSSTENSGLGRTVNPWDTTRVPGGSSGGSAVAVAARMAFAALGSDTGGSIRQPASFCGVTGLKPTYGRVSRYGLVAYGSSLDQVGPLARSVEDCALLLGVIAGHDPRDSTSVDTTIAPVPDYTADLENPVQGLRIGVVPQTLSGADRSVRDAVAAAVEVYRMSGASVVDVAMPHLDYAIAAYYVIATAEASSNLARYDGVHYGHRTANPRDYVEVYVQSRAEGLGKEVKRRIMLGTYALSSGYYDAYYLKALKVRSRIRGDFTRAFEACDCILMPVAPTTAFKLGEKTADPLQMYLEDVYTISANLAGIPGMSLPAGMDDRGLPIGLQILGPAFAEHRLLRIARMFESQTDWHSRRPEEVSHGRP